MTRVIKTILPTLFEKNHEIQFSTNQTLKDKIKKIIIIQKHKKNISIKRIKIKIQITKKYYI